MQVKKGKNDWGILFGHPCRHARLSSKIEQTHKHGTIIELHVWSWGSTSALLSRGWMFESNAIRIILWLFYSIEKIAKSLQYSALSIA